MNENLILTLENYGFSEKEAKIYLTALSLGEVQASTIARNIGEKRTTTYSILKEMVKKGYVSEIEKNSTLQYSAVSPNVMLGKLEDKFTKFKEIVPLLLGIINNKDVNNVDIQYFYGDEGLGSLFSDFADSEIEVKAFAGTWKYRHDILIEKSKIYIQKRQEKGLNYKRIISKHNIEGKEGQVESIDDIKDKDVLYKRQTVIVDELDNIQADIDIYGPGKVSFLFFKNNIPNIIIIKNQLIYDCLNSIFDCLWKQNYKG